MENHVLLWRRRPADWLTAGAQRGLLFKQQRVRGGGRAAARRRSGGKRHIREGFAFSSPSSSSSSSSSSRNFVILVSTPCARVGELHHLLLNHWAVLDSPPRTSRSGTFHGYLPISAGALRRINDMAAERAYDK
ncbi:unnamed protein product [Pleuronectes platessa]|uniref:Uncharacterized protein n=1 Tax=Pleuronectes platessa TaxID=8262 RepID=A0A9N7UH53_PLEPL|nr:unnamed protein product [Pleuronectes platessa]